MAKKVDEKLLERVEKLLAPVLEPIELELVDMEYIQDGAYWFLRIYLEKIDGKITLDECAKVSNSISEDVDRMIEDKFFLEVSSPGLERPLKKEKDFVRFTGEKIKVILRHKVEDSRNWTGKLEKCEESMIYLNTEEKTLEIPFEEIKKANIVFEFKDK
ncbi:ribosome maturation factor RimP [Psychrilyobacter sp.]|uniref:ribosome maturation factor RimP n=1 Tax=Psychrilyobacter sp. TaxID=2586924 RepID=UPI0030184733